MGPHEPQRTKVCAVKKHPPSDDRPVLKLAEIVELDVPTRLDLPAEKILNKALTVELEACLVVGWGPNDELYFDSTYADGPEALWLLEVAKRRLMQVGDPEGE